MENLKLLFRVYFRPAPAMSEILDNGSWVFAAIAVLVVSFTFDLAVTSRLERAFSVPTFSQFYQPPDVGQDWTPALENQYRDAEKAYFSALEKREKIPLVGDAFFRLFTFDRGFFAPLFSLSIFYVPALIFLFSIFSGMPAKFGVNLRRDYGALATCTLMNWAAAHLPFALIGLLFRGSPASSDILFALWIFSGILFGIYMIFALRTVLGVNYSISLSIVSIAWIAISFGVFIAKFVSPWAFSPFLLFFLVLYFGGFLGGEVRGLGNSFRRRQDFKRYLHSATVNPKDADAHVQLGLIYLQRRQDAKAREHFEKAFQIDNEEIDANYELGKLARKSGELQKALDHFGTVVEQNDKHALSEIWREIGATYLEADMLSEAAEALEKFVDRRPVDSEGLYYLGKVYKLQNEPAKAREMFEQAVDAARTSPDFRRGELRQWSKLAQKEL